MSVTIKDIARISGVAQSTVSKALNDRSGINNNLRAKIKRLAKQYNYAPYIYARETGMYNNDMKSIAVVYSNVNRYISEEIQKGINVIHQHGYCELRYFINQKKDLFSLENENELVVEKLMNNKSISGIIFAFLQVSDVILNRFHQNNIPTVLLNCYTNYGKCVTINNFKAMYDVVDILIKAGYLNIGIIMPQENMGPVWEERYNGYKRCLEHHDIQYNPGFIAYENTFTIENSAFVTKQLIQEHPEITAIVYGSDYQAYGGIKVLKELNKIIPRDMAVIGFDDLELNQIIKPSLSSVKQPIEEMGAIGAKMLISAVNNKDFSHSSVELSGTLNLRDSCLIHSK